MVRRWGFVASVATAVLVLGVAMAAHPSLRNEIAAEFDVLFLVSWAPPVFGGLLAWILVKALGSREQLDRRIEAAMEGHPLDRELGWLALCLLGFLVCLAGLTEILRVYETAVNTDVAVAASFASRMLFLLVLPILVMDRSGITLDGRGTSMPGIAMGASEPWRWLGLVPVAAAVGLTGYVLVPHTGLPEPSYLLIGVLLAYAAVSVCEEVFFRSMVQTRLETRMGRWGGIMATSLLFALVYTLLTPFDRFAQLPGAGMVHDLGLAMLTYLPSSVLYGYLWTCFRNVWVNVLLRIGLFVLLVPSGLGSAVV
ncbi:CPBP family intramembrane glutamic endopeptidase [Nocardiopsis algeriensis]|uniref:Membrane protease YdiL (CAAX protease family) n=1 Tax=Nocardiopsis algeriensis TaxID=1478215 RepID=A0A841IXZ8_9ACTN|nr:CPBP family intramembrane glutamic endopeptidase [Nocardiopsis algeriensis]MBB6122156.1 membrane protease YdiL (CAAX protease family) [Nocardiopsis algeriensis]